jgi:hypothetical protein
MQLASGCAGGLILLVFTTEKVPVPWFTARYTAVGGVATNSTWNFTIVASDMGGLIVGDVVSY